MDLDISHLVAVARKKRKRKSKKRCAFFHKVVFKPADDSLYAAKILIGRTNNLLPDNWKTCKVTGPTYYGDTLLLDFDDCNLVIHLNIDLNVIKEIITSNVFNIHFEVETDDIYIRLYFTQLPLKKFTTRIGNCLKAVFFLVFNITAHESVGKDSSEMCDDDVNAVYKEIVSVRQDVTSLPVVREKIENLKPVLRRYQQEAVSWMLFKETSLHDSTEIPHPLYEEVTLASGKILYFNKFSGHVDIIKPLVEVSNNGGILADEMGLGKTVEVLACILLHQKQMTSEQTELISENCQKVNHSTNSSVVVDSPVIVKKESRKRPVPCDNKINENLDTVKKIKVPENWVKASSKKTTTRIALEMWYESMLRETHSKKVTKFNNATSSHSESVVECVCGDSSKTGTVTCIDCKKVQHADCLGYKSSFGEYRCPKCWMTVPLVESAATLIVCPLALRKQWCKEICKHVGTDFRILDYRGFSVTPIYPIMLLEYDLVITTYSVLQSELRLTNNESTHTFRHQKRYSVPGSVLTYIKWWRLCLDEAQMADSPTSMVALMAQKLSSNYRWAITGTPISNGITDLYGLINYLQFKPYDDQEIWNYGLYQPYLKGHKGPMYNLFRDVIWRSSKEDVLDQINIPKQTIQEYWLEFSAVEKYFYKREHELSCEAFLTISKTYSSGTALFSLHRSTFKHIMGPLLYIRQACTYPNTVRGRYLATKKQVSSVEDLLEALILKTTTECEESLRIVISALNGLAGVYLLLQEPQEACSEYRKVLQLSTRFTENENEIKLSVDKLQLIHTIHNLAEILDNHTNMPPTLRDANLRSDCQKIEQKYVEKFNTESVSAYKDTLSSSATVSKIRNNFILSPGQWYADVLERVSIGDYFDELMTRMRNIHETNNVEYTLGSATERQIMLLIATWDEEITKHRDALIEKINSLFTTLEENNIQLIIGEELVKQVTDCHLRPQKKTKKRDQCPLCLANTYFKAYECKLFSMHKRTQTFEDMSLKGSWKPTSEELILKSLLSLGKTKNINSDVLKDGDTHIYLLDALKKEFKDIRRFWTFLDQQICAQDEVEMCKIRLTLKSCTEDENEGRCPAKDVLKRLSYVLENKLETLHMLSSHELDYQKTVLQNEEKQGVNTLEKNLGILSYLKTLHKQQYEGQSPDPCPICKNTLEEHWSILPCGHSFCIECMNSLIQGESGRQDHLIHCSVCREKHKIYDISYIKASCVAENEDDTKIIGHYSTKIEAIIKMLIKLTQADPLVKVLIFSSWPSVLKCLKEALEKNSVLADLLLSSGFEKRIEHFKNSKNINVILMPVTLGAKGLNLIEATHVVLVEPLLNVADELQAVGRVHRIGQTKPTFVHKFFIKNTIEESIQHAVNSNAESWDRKKVTVGQLRNLFLSTEESSNND